MALIANRRSVMTLFSHPTCPHSHRVRFALSEKGIKFDIVDVEGPTLPEDLLDLNPYNDVPTLVDRDLVLYDSRVIIEYLDERFPHPPLIPGDPGARAQLRLALFRIERDWYALARQIEEAKDRKAANKVRKILRESILATAEVFAAKPFFLSDELSLVDCTVAPIIWRLPHYEIDLPPEEAKPILDYADNRLARQSFKESRTEGEEEMRA